MIITHDKVGITLDIRPELISGAIWQSEGKWVLTPQAADELATGLCQAMVDIDVCKLEDK